jgi:uncharacterized metal-binding protein YceD (DUF177 family)
VETELNIYLSEVTEEGLELSGTLDDSIYGFEDEFLKPFAGLRYELGVLHVGSELLVRGRIEQDFEAVCSRCGEDFDFTVKIPDFAASFEINEKTEFVELTTEVRECILLALPTYPVCREDCPGIEKKEEKAPDSRWDALDDLKKG